LACERENPSGAVRVPTPGYKFLPHTTDAYIESVGATFEEALENAALALFDTMCDLNSISRELHEVITVEGADKLELLYNWLESLLLKFELERKVYNNFQVSLTSTPRGDLKVTAEADGDRFNRERHRAKVEVKAVTYHRMEVVQEGDVTIVRFILDL
jgi:SHS2 domain-containing protein